MKPSEGRGSLILNNFAPLRFSVAGRFFLKRIDRAESWWFNKGIRGRGPAVFYVYRQPVCIMHAGCFF